MCSESIRQELESQLQLHFSTKYKIRFEIISLTHKFKQRKIRQRYFTFEGLFLRTTKLIFSLSEKIGQNRQNETLLIDKIFFASHSWLNSGIIKSCL